MRVKMVMMVAGVLFLLVPAISSGADEDLALGAKLYKQNCYKCHPAPSKHAKEANIIEYMRKPRFRMPTFGPDEISDAEAKAIEKYVHSFKEK